MKKLLILSLIAYNINYIIAQPCPNGTLTDPNPAFTSPTGAGFKTNTFNW